MYWVPEMFPTSDNSLMEVTLTFNPESGSILPRLGDHTITATARDSSGNEASCTFVVSVLGMVSYFFSRCRSLEGG